LASRNRLRLVFLVTTLASGAAHALACGDGGGSGSSGGTDGDGGASALPDAAVGPADASAPATTMRLAHLAEDLGPVDFCYRMAKTSSFEGPVLGDGLGGLKPGDAGADADGASDDASSPSDPLDAGDDGGSDDAGDGGAARIGYRTVSRYLTLSASGPLTIALVAPGSTSCATPLFTADVTLDPGKLSTVAILGRTAADGGDGALSLVAFIDDRMTVPAKARVRMIHAALGTEARTPAGALSVRASSSQTVTVAERVEPKKAASPSATVPVDSLGYATIAPVPSPAQLAVGAAASTMATDASSDSWVGQAGALDLRGGSLHTGFVLSGGADQPFEVLWCTDTSTTGDVTTCAVVR
jgi:hypothetical protein